MTRLFYSGYFKQTNKHENKNIDMSFDFYTSAMRSQNNCGWINLIKISLLIRNYTDPTMETQHSY